MWATWALPLWQEPTTVGMLVGVPVGCQALLPAEAAGLLVGGVRSWHSWLCGLGSTEASASPLVSRAQSWGAWIGGL